MKKVYLDELENSSNELINYSQNNIGKTIEELKKSPNNMIWQGTVHNSYIAGYNKKIEELVKMNNGLTNLAKYLLSAKESYSNANARINNAYEELLSEMKRIGK